MYTETKPINIYDRDAVAAANAAAARSGTDEEVVEESPTTKLPETLEEATAAMMTQFEEEQKQEAARKELEANILPSGKTPNLNLGYITPTPTDDSTKSIATTRVTHLELDELKVQINDSLAELANIALEHQRMIEQINERLAHFNQRSGQKI